MEFSTCTTERENLIIVSKKAKKISYVKKPVFYDGIWVRVAAVLQLEKKFDTGFTSLLR